jgi:vacuolar-type H+-ATPase subunit H
MSTTYQDKIADMTKALEAALDDAKKIDEKNVKTARTRLRKALQEIINESKDFRKTILEDGKVGE